MVTTFKRMPGKTKYNRIKYTIIIIIKQLHNCPMLDFFHMTSIFLCSVPHWSNFQNALQIMRPSCGRSSSVAKGIISRPSLKYSFCLPLVICYMCYDGISYSHFSLSKPNIARSAALWAVRILFTMFFLSKLAVPLDILLQVEHTGRKLLF